MPAHYAVAWLTFGAVPVHIGAKLPLIRQGLAGRPDDDPGEAALSRRGLLRTAAVGTGLALFATAGMTVPWLRRRSPLATTAGHGPQGLPVNRTAHAAGVSRVDGSWRLRIQWPDGTAAVRIESLEMAGAYRTSTLPAAHVADPLTLLALRVNGEVLDLDHGYPCRVIAPTRAGVLQTKWVDRLTVLP